MESFWGLVSPAVCYAAPMPVLSRLVVVVALARSQPNGDARSFRDPVLEVK